VGIKGYPYQAAYSASKHGVAGLTKSLAAEVKENGIRVSMILPGGVDTALVGNTRPDLDKSILLKPEDIANTVLYLLSLPERAMVDQIYIRRSASKPF
jgi:3-oxoacyl-[acyl-carrier protein] reductase